MVLLFKFWLPGDLSQFAMENQPILKFGKPIHLLAAPQPQRGELKCGAMPGDPL